LNLITSNSYKVCQITATETNRQNVPAALLSAIDVQHFALQLGLLGIMVIVAVVMYCGLQSYVLWSSELCIVVFRVMYCGLQSYVLWSSELCIVVFRLMYCGLQSYVLWSSELCIVVFRVMYCGLQSYDSL